MSWSIPTKIEEDFISGKAQYRTFQTGAGGQSILPVPSNAYIVVFGYDFSPAGGGFRTEQERTAPNQLHNVNTRWFETQQISFYTGTDFYPFIHHINTEYGVITTLSGTTQEFFTIDSTPIARQIYITSSNDITITHGLILRDPVATANAIPVTNRTPSLLTYGGSGQVINTQTDFGPGATPIQFMQPSPKDYQDFGFGLLPNGASGQAFATPNTTNGLRDASQFLGSLGLANEASCNYFLNLHYALYTQSIPEQRG